MLSDTLTSVYGDKWEAADNLTQEPSWIQWLSQNDLVYVVGLVSLVIWIGILYYLIRIEKKLSVLENKPINSQNS